ncbi:methyltransferase type 11 [Helicobacter jaachi]|uniref:Methyltransferase type 11 n=2 Tax=Helicobacter jaachi TaxID=1677920 RepID=A0A4V6I2I8_9HELI|nr:methyltransferase type 11 [Helicobacter jaachi]
MLEIFDQMVRMQSGGEMQRCFDLVQETQNKAFNEIIKHRVGEDLLTPHPHTQAKIPLRAKLTLDKIINKCLNLYLKALRLCVPKSLRDEIFISTSIGERHKWSYDRFSLARLLHKSGFTHITQQDYAQSQIPHFNTYLLDINADNTPYKGVSSLYVECIKP